MKSPGGTLHLERKRHRDEGPPKGPALLGLSLFRSEHLLLSLQGISALAFGAPLGRLGGPTVAIEMLDRLLAALATYPPPLLPGGIVVGGDQMTATPPATRAGEAPLPHAGRALGALAEHSVIASARLWRVHAGQPTPPLDTRARLGLLGLPTLLGCSTQGSLDRSLVPLAVVP